jgi:hypothetical protein
MKIVSRRARRRRRTVRTDAVRQTQRAGRLYAPTDILDLRLRVAYEPLRLIHLREVLGSEDLEARDDALARKVINGLDRPCLGHLDLERALAESEAHDLGDVLLHLRLQNDIVPGYTQVDVALADEGGDVRRGEEDSREHVEDERAQD